MIGNFDRKALALDPKVISPILLKLQCSSTPAPAPNQNPTPVPVLSIPGIVQAENYNGGGEGVGFHNSIPGNLGGAVALQMEKQGPFQSRQTAIV